MEGSGVLWTAVPAEVVLAGMAEPLPSLREITVEGRLLQVIPGLDGTGVVQRLISSNPNDFLDPRWQPGVRLPLHGGGAGAL